jgi:hypothetical protein
MSSGFCNSVLMICSQLRLAAFKRQAEPRAEPLPLKRLKWPFLSGRLKEAETNLCLLRGLQAEDVAGELEELREVSLQNTTSLSQGHPQASWRNLLHRTTLLPMALLGRQCRITHSCAFLLPFLTVSGQ